MEIIKNELSSSLGSTAVLVTNQFQCERLIQAGRSVADISKTDLIVLNVQSNEYPANPDAIQYLFNIASQNSAMMNVMYAEDIFKTIVQYGRIRPLMSSPVSRRPKTRFCTKSGTNLLTSPFLLWMKRALCMR